jgi:hypothetical protein
MTNLQSEDCTVGAVQAIKLIRLYDTARILLYDVHALTLVHHVHICAYMHLYHISYV